MQLPLGWLAEYLTPPPIAALLDRLTAIGHMVDGPMRDTPDGPVIPLEIRQNRPDCLSIYGLAREVAAAFDGSPAALDLADPPIGGYTQSGDNGELYLLRVRGARLDRLPDTLAGRLTQYGVRSTFPLVDLANYVMVELGQPLHIYAAELDPLSIEARPGRAGERLELIGGATVVLAPDDLVVADCNGPLALASVLGGQASAVGAGASELVVEAGIFPPHLVRRTARRHGLTTEASIRGSKVLAPMLAEVALRRFLALLVEYGDVTSAELWRPYATPELSPAIQLELRELLRVGGVTVEPQQVVAILSALGFATALDHDGATLTARPPWWRTDIDHPMDLVEEVVRMIGYDRVTPVVPPPIGLVGSEPSVWEQEERIRALLCAWGYDEAILDSFLLDDIGGLPKHPDTLWVENSPAGQGALRPALLPNLLSASRHVPLLSARRQLFEIGHVFRQDTDRPAEDRAVAWLCLRGAGPARWDENNRHEFYRLKAEALTVLAALGIEGSTERIGRLPFPFVNDQSIEMLTADGTPVGRVGALDHRAYGTTPAQAAYGVEIRLPVPHGVAATPAQRARREANRIDISVAIEPGVTAAHVRRVLAAALGDNALDLTLIDVYAGQGSGAPESLTFRIIYDRAHGAPQAVWEQLRICVEAMHGARVRG